MNTQTKSFAEYAANQGMASEEDVKKLYTDLQEESQCDDNQFFRVLMAIGFQNVDINAAISDLR